MQLVCEQQVHDVVHDIQSGVDLFSPVRQFVDSLSLPRAQINTYMKLTGLVLSRSLPSFCFVGKIRHVNMQSAIFFYLFFLSFFLISIAIGNYLVIGEWVFPAPMF